MAGANGIPARRFQTREHQERTAMAQTASDVLVDTLINWGVDTVFGIPGDGINGIIEALRTRKDEICFV